MSENEQHDKNAVPKTKPKSEQRDANGTAKTRSESKQRGVKSASENEELKGLILQIQQGDDSAFPQLITMYSPLIAKLSKQYSDGAAGALEFEDLKQEAELALFKAAQRYDLQQTKVTFGLYAKICIQNRLCSELRKLSRIKRKADSVSLHGEPADRSVPSESYRTVMNMAKTVLTEKEFFVFNHYLQHDSYKKIAGMLGCSCKSVDNALTRAKRKLKENVRKSGKD